MVSGGANDETVSVDTHTDLFASLVYVCEEAEAFVGADGSRECGGVYRGREEEEEEGEAGEEEGGAGEESQCHGGRRDE